MLPAFKLWIRRAWNAPASPVASAFLPRLICSTGQWCHHSIFQSRFSTNIFCRRENCKLVDWIWMNEVNAKTHTKKQTTRTQWNKRSREGGDSPSLLTREPDVCPKTRWKRYKTEFLVVSRDTIVTHSRKKKKTLGYIVAHKRRGERKKKRERRLNGAMLIGWGWITSR